MSKPSWSLTLPALLRDELWAHLFPGDGDEHGAVVLAGVVRETDGLRLLGAELLIARDGADYAPGLLGYRALRPEFVQRAALQARARGLAYLAVHCHGGNDRVGFSGTDLDSHRRGYPALTDITGQPVGALVAARHALAGELWLPNGEVQQLDHTRVPGENLERLHPQPPAAPARATPGFDRQVRVFGDRGQALLAQTTVAIVGLGGLGSIVAEYLGRLGVGRFVLVDAERVDATNLPRMIAARDLDATLAERARAFHLPWPKARRKTALATRNIRRANPRAAITSFSTGVEDPRVARAVARSDYVFLAADSAIARHVVNAIVHQYLVPGIEAGVKVRSDDDGAIDDIHVAIRPLTPGRPCLWCSGLIDATELALETTPEHERNKARYVPEVTAPSVITLNGIAAGEATTRFLFAVTGLLQAPQASALLRFPRGGDLKHQTVPPDPECRWCGRGPHSALGRGDARPLPAVRRGAA